MSDADRARAEARAAWEGASGGWGRRRAVMQAAAEPVSHWLVEAIHPQPGHVVLEVAAGVGDTGFLAAELIHPGGRLITTDGAEGMLEAAKARAEQLGIQNVEFTPMEAEWLDMGAASVDAILCRWGYMLVPDPESALRDARRVLRPDGRIAIAVWDVRERNPAMTAAGAALRAVDALPPPTEGEPGPFALADPAVVEELLGAAGFIEVEVDAVDIVHRFASGDDFFDVQRDMSPTLQAALPGLSPAVHAQMRDALDEILAPYAQPDGSLVIPGRTLVAAATA